jgi:hypothetical protein
LSEIVGARRLRPFLLISGVIATAACGATADERQQIEPSYDDTGKLQLLKYDSNADGKIDTWSHMDGTRILHIEIDETGDGLADRWEYYTPDQQIEKVGSSQAGDGIVDSWAYYGPDGQMNRLERSAKRDGTVTRTEFYEGGVVIRAEEDANADGTTDKWEVYEGSRLASVAFDTRGTGSPERRLVYGVDGKVRIEVADGNGGFSQAPGPPGRGPSPR